MMCWHLLIKFHRPSLWKEDRVKISLGQNVSCLVLQCYAFLVDGADFALVKLQTMVDDRRWLQ